MRPGRGDFRLRIAARFSGGGRTGNVQAESVTITYGHNPARTVMKDREYIRSLLSKPSTYWTLSLVGWLFGLGIATLALIISLRSESPAWLVGDFAAGTVFMIGLVAYTAIGLRRSK